MKKTITFLVMILLIISTMLSACSSSDKSEGTSSKTDKSEGTSSKTDKSEKSSYKIYFSEIDESMARELAQDYMKSSVGKETLVEALQEEQLQEGKQEIHSNIRSATVISIGSVEYIYPYDGHEDVKAIWVEGSCYGNDRYGNMIDDYNFSWVIGFSKGSSSDELGQIGSIDITILEK